MIVVLGRKSSFPSWSSAEYGRIGQKTNKKSIRCTVKTTATTGPSTGLSWTAHWLVGSWEMGTVRNVEVVGRGQRQQQRCAVLCLQELADLLADSNSKSKVVLREDNKRGEYRMSSQG